MRIIAGQFRRRHLNDINKEAANIRPTPDRVRQAIFSHLESGLYDSPLKGAHVLDLFAGTGAMGLEALSRGATSADFIENDAYALKLIAKNCQSLGIEPQCHLHNIDATREPPAPPVQKASLVFLDPPYRQNIGQKALALFIKKAWIEPNALIIWEEGESISPPTGVSLLMQRRYAQSWIHVLKADIPPKNTQT